MDLEKQKGKGGVMEPMAEPDEYLRKRYPVLNYYHTEKANTPAGFLGLLVYEQEMVTCFRELAHERAMRISADNYALQLRGEIRILERLVDGTKPEGQR